jgi:hypothetical protein
LLNLWPNLRTAIIGAFPPGGGREMAFAIAAECLHRADTGLPAQTPLLANALGLPVENVGMLALAMSERGVLLATSDGFVPAGMPEDDIYETGFDTDQDTHYALERYKAALARNPGLIKPAKRHARRVPAKARIAGDLIKAGYDFARESGIEPVCSADPNTYTQSLTIRVWRRFWARLRHEATAGDTTVEMLANLYLGLALKREGYL